MKRDASNLAVYVEVIVCRSLRADFFFLRINYNKISISVISVLFLDLRQENIDLQ